MTLLSAGRLEEAAEAAAAAHLRAPDDPLVLNLSASIALRRGLPNLAKQWSRAALALDPHDQRALADLAFASAAIGAEDPVIDLSQLLRVVALSVPPGFASVEAFNHALAAAILGSPALATPAPDAPLVGGRRLPDFFGLDARWKTPLVEAFRAAISGYVDGTTVGAAHPVRTGRPAKFEFVGWANVMGAGDFERPHIHESGWLSGVYYVETPAVPGVPTGQEPMAGSLLLGGHSSEGALRSVLIPHQPRAGEFVVFPSYLFHRTVPFTGAGRRISVAFDALRAPLAHRNDVK